MMSDDDVLRQVRDSLSDVCMHTPVAAVLAAGHSRKHRRWMTGLATTGGAVALALALALTSITSSGHTPTTANTARLAAFTVTSAPGGESVLTLRKGGQYRLDPTALRQALASHGIPAVVNVGTMCDTGAEPSSGLDQVISTTRQADGSVVTTFDPSALPAGSEISIGYFTNHTAFALIETGDSLHCSADSGSSSSGTTPGQQSQPVTVGGSDPR
jgi:hypothetical protein